MMIKRLFTAVLAAACAFLSIHSTSRAFGEELSIVTWNIEWYPGKRRNPDDARAAEHAAIVRDTLRAINPDLLLTQEMRDWQSFADLCDAVPGLRPVTVSAFRAEESGEYWPQQLGVASKRPVMAAWTEFWRQGELHPRRGFAAAVLPLSDGRLLLVYNVHLKSNRAGDEAEEARNFATRNESIRQLLAHVHDIETVFLPDRVAGVVIGGDFNTNSDGQFVDEVDALLRAGGFVNAWGDTPREERLTWRGSDLFSPSTFDTFYVRGLPVPRAEMLDAPEAASDHLPVRIRLEIPPLYHDAP